MRILMTADTVGGVWTYCVELIRALADHDCEILLCTMGQRPTDEQRTEIGALPNAELRESDFALEWMPDPWEDVDKAAGWLLGLEDEFRPDIVHLNGFAHGALPWRCSALVVAHSCVVSWWRAVKNESAPAEWDEYRQRVGRGVRSAWTVAAPTQSMLNEMQRNYGPLPRTAVVHNARSGEASPQPKEPFILAAGRLWDEGKNFSVLDAAAGRVAWPVRLAGQERAPDGHEIGIRNAQRLGWLPPARLAEEFGRASIYALPALYEPFGLTVLEAARAGCALVLGSIPSLREVWGNAALFVPPRSPERLAAALASLTESEELRRELAARAQTQARRYTTARFGREYRALYDRMLRQTAVPLSAARREATVS